MIEKRLPYTILITLAEHDYSAMQLRSTMLREMIAAKDAALTSIQFKLWHELERMDIHHLSRELAALQQKMVELENILVEWEAPGWTSS